MGGRAMEVSKGVESKAPLLMETELPQLMTTPVNFEQDMKACGDVQYRQGKRE